MVRDGVFDDVDTAICWHPAPFSGVNQAFSLACMEVDFTFTGRASPNRFDMVRGYHTNGLML